MPFSDDPNAIIEKWITPVGTRAIAAIAGISLLITLIAALVHATGGTAYVWLHMMYVPIILAAAMYHVTGGVLAAVAAGLAIGPFMPLEVNQHIAQETGNWILRTLFFLLVGMVSGILFSRLYVQFNRLKKTHTALEAAHKELQNTQLELIQAEKLESLGRLAAGVAHEVKNPLAILQLGVDFLSNTAPDTQTIRETLDEMDGAVKKADSIIKGLVDYSRFEKLDLQPQPLNAIIEKSLLLVRHEFSKNHIVVNTALAAKISETALDRSKIEQVFINLFINASHAMEGGGTLSVTTTERKISKQDQTDVPSLAQRFSMEDDAVVVEIADTGTGIPADKLPKLFDPFFTTKPVGKGTGLGLSVCKKIIDLHAGVIDIRNGQKAGALVTIFLKPFERS